VSLLDPKLFRKEVKEDEENRTNCEFGFNRFVSRVSCFSWYSYWATFQLLC